MKEKMKRKKHRVIKTLLLLFLLLILFLLFELFVGGKMLQVTRTDVFSAGLPPEFDGFRIVQLSDVHGSLIGKDNRGILDRVRELSPDVIVLTGDLTDKRHPDTGRMTELAEKLCAIAPVYSVNGNHEAIMKPAEREKFLTELKEKGVHVLESETASLLRDGAGITLIGLKDPGQENGSWEKREAAVYDDLVRMVNASDGFTLVLSHRPEMADKYAQAGAELVLCGHAHGGQIRIPFLGGLYAPGQGLLPEYDSGLYRIGDTFLYVNRGIGNSVFPLRVLNRPEIALITLRCGTGER